MANKIVLVSDDSDFFEYISSKLELRKSDELFRYSFNEVLLHLHEMTSAVVIVNSENSKEKTLDLLKILKENPVVVSAFNDDDVFRRKCYRLGMFDFMTLLTPDAEFRARMIPALSVAAILEKNLRYREILVKNNVITPNNEVYVDYNYILDKELEEINRGNVKAVFAAISPNEKTKFLMQANLIETVILNNIRRNDILMNFAANKYFLLMFDIDYTSAKKLWEKIASELPQKLYAGFTIVANQRRQQLINEALNRLHEAINADYNIASVKSNPVNSLSMIQGDAYPYSNFKQFKQEFGRKIEQVITPVFYQVHQKYSGKLTGIIMKQGTGEGYGAFYIKGKHSSSSFRITSPGFSKINIDITYQKDSDNIDAKRITIEPEELEAGLLEDLLEQFILDYKRGLDNDS